jgi:hypothetical protein
MPKKVEANNYKALQLLYLPNLVLPSTVWVLPNRKFNQIENDKKKPLRC